MRLRRSDALLIQDSLHFSDAGLQWVVNAYTVAFAGFPMLGGFLTQAFDWPTIFFLNVPVGIAMAIAARRDIRSQVRPTASANSTSAARCRSALA